MIKILVNPCQTSPSLTILVPLWFISMQLFRERLSYIGHGERLTRHCRKWLWVMGILRLVKYYSPTSSRRKPKWIKLVFFFQYLVRSKNTCNLVNSIEFLKSFVSFYFVFLQLITWLTVSCDFERACASHGAQMFCPTICRHIVTNRVTLWCASYSACVVYTKTIIHLSVGESGWYLPPLRRIIVNYYLFGVFLS